MLDVPTILLAGATLINQPVTGCPSHAKVHLQLTLRREEVVVSSGLTLAEVRKIYDASGKKIPHEPLGFYVQSYRYAIQADGPTLETCPYHFDVRVVMGIDNRRIVLANEAMQRDCLRDVALAHYRLHAMASDATFLTLASRVQHLVAEPAFLNSLVAAGTNRPILEAAIKSILEGELQSFHGKYQDDQVSVDTPIEVQLLADACSTAI